MKSYGANTYRFSLAWPRIIPLGGRSDPVNEKGLAFYDAVIDECLRLGMKPFVTLFQYVFALSPLVLPLASVEPSSTGSTHAE